MRASSANLGRKCGLYPVLADQGLTRSTAATKAGTDFHAIAAAELVGDPWPDVESEDAVEDARLWAPWWASLGLGAPTVVEYAMEATIGGVFITGHADAIWDDPAADMVVVVDWKRVAWAWGYPDIEEDLQLLTYGEMARRDFGRSRAVVMRVHVPALEPFQCVLDDDRAQWLGQQLAAIDNDPTAKTAPYCTGCLARHACEPYQAGGHQLVAMRNMEIVLTDETAGEIAVQLGGAEELLGRVREALKDHVRNGGAVSRGGQVWRPTAVKTDRVVDAGAVVEYLDPHMDGLASKSTKATMTKKSLVKACECWGIPVDDALKDLRESGAVKQSQSETWKWRGKR